MTTSYPNRWEAEDINRIRALAIEGKTGKEIGAVMGATRNAVIGVCYRNGIPLGGASPLPQRRVAIAAAPAIAKKRQEVRQRITAPVKPPKPPEPPKGPLGGIPIEALDKHTCRWPIHDELPARYCGAHADGSYCPHHAARAFVPAKGRIA